VREQFGCIFVFLGDQVSFELPTFPGGLDLISAQPAHWTLACPWYMVVANGFDARHFSHTHDRHLIDVPQLERSSALSISIRYRYQIRGSGLIDRVTRVLSGSEVEFEVTGWGGNLALVKARFKNDVSYGMVVVEPRYFQAGSHPANAQVTVIVSAMRRGHGLFSRVRDRLVVAVKRFAIRRFMMEDANGLQQLDFGHTNLRRGDEMLAEYLRWVSELPANLAPSPVASHSFNGDS
jgi:phenylpropionate dioxygenase-like ring-hydroxylating dioxygenase large terminal subunit